MSCKRSSKAAKALLIPPQDPPQLPFVAGEGAKDNRQDRLLLGQVVQDAVMGGQVRALRANLARTDLTHDGRHTPFHDQLDVGSPHAADRDHGTWCPQCGPATVIP